jgi:DNA-directed RNA polymerase subunit RPC12/RpoP
VGEVVKCPYCGFEGEFNVLKRWRYRWWNVYYYQCPKCSGNFRYQVDPEGRYKSYIIKVSKKSSLPKFG